jgi:hypothetical protein
MLGGEALPGGGTGSGGPDEFPLPHQGPQIAPTGIRANGCQSKRLKEFSGRNGRNPVGHMRQLKAVFHTAHGFGALGVA